MLKLYCFRKEFKGSFFVLPVVIARVISVDWENDKKKTPPPPTTKPATTKKPRAKLPEPQKGETDWIVGRKPDPNLLEIFKKGIDPKQTGGSDEDFLAEPAMFPFFFNRPKIIRVELEKLYRGKKYLSSTTKGHQFNIKFSSMHRVPYQVGKTYLLTAWTAGKQLMTNDCNWFSEKNKLTTVQHYGLRRYYWLYCACKIQLCVNGRCNKHPLKCHWNVPLTQIDHKRADFLSANRVCMSQCGSSCGFYDPLKRVSCARRG